MKILYPIELLLSSVFAAAYKITGHYGYALIIMSICITVITTPIYLLADYWKNKEKAIQDLMKDDIDCIKAHYNKQKQFYLTQAAHRIYNYKAWYPLRTSLGILIEIPFFFAAFNVLSNFKGYSGVAFGLIKDLGAPDGLLFSINLLPIVMTLLNVISAIIYSRSFRLKDNTQPFVLAAVFLLFLYDSPSALLIYWSFNNFFSLIKNVIIEIVKKNKEKFELVNLRCEIKKNRNLVLIILCVLFYIGFTFVMAYDHHKIKYIFILLSLIQIGLFVYKFIIKRKRLTIRYFIAYGIYAFCSVIYLLRSHVIDFDSALIILCILNCLLFYNLFAEKKDFIEKEKSDKIITPVLFSLIFTVLLPLQVYFGNKQEFPVQLNSIFIRVLITFIISSAILLCFSLFIFKKSQFFLKTLFFFFILYLFNGIFLRLNAGMMSEFYFQNDSVIKNPALSLFFKDFIIILFAIYIVNYFYGKKKSFVIPIYITALVTFSVLSISNAVKYKDIKVAVNNTYKDIPSDTKELHTFTTTGKNVYVFMSDMMNGNYMERILQDFPELEDQLSGFTWYRDCLAKASDTQTAMASLYGGNDYSLIEFNKNDLKAGEAIHKAADKMISPFIEDNWEIAFSSCSDLFKPNDSILNNPKVRSFNDHDYSDYYAKLHKIEKNANAKIYLLQILPVFNTLPHSSKKYLYQKGTWNSPGLQLKERQRTGCDYCSHAELIPEFVNFTTEQSNQFKFFTSTITHTPFCYNKDLEFFSSYNDLEETDADLSYYAAQRSVLLLSELVTKLKENNAYDNSIIIFVSDHGNHNENNTICNQKIPQLTDPNYHYHLSMANTVLLIKGFDENDKLVISDAQVQNSDIYDFIQEYVFNNSNKFSEYLSYTDDNPRTRTYSTDLYEHYDFSELTTVPCVNYKVEGALSKASSWSMYD